MIHPRPCIRQPSILCISMPLRRHRRRKDGVSHGIPVDEALGRLIKALSVVAVLLRDAVLEGVVGEGLDEEVADGLEHGGDLGRGLPVLRLEEAEADVTEGVVGDVGVVDARGKLGDGGLEGVLGRQGEDDAVAARVVDCAGGRGEGDVPGVEGVVGAEGDGAAFGG